VDRSAGRVTLTMRNQGSVGVNHQVFPNVLLPFQADPHTIAAGKTAIWTWDAAATDGVYDFSVYGPDRFLRRFAGTVTRGDRRDIGIPSATAEVGKQGSLKLKLTLTNDGGAAIRFQLHSNDFIDHTDQVVVPPRSSRTVNWLVNDWGYYDVVVTSNAGDGFRYRFAGRV
jgi:phospholipase C